MTMLDTLSKRRGSPIAAQTIGAARAARSAKRERANAKLRYAVEAIQGSGVSTLGAIARTLEGQGILTPAGRPTWQASQVARLVRAIERREKALRIRLAERGIRL